jgi:predicted phage terminase large subunit-like protein
MDELMREAHARMSDLKKYDWDGSMFGEPVGRPEQIMPDTDWTYGLVTAGRGWGKTRCAAEWVRQRVKNGARRICIAGRSAADVRDVLVEGESGILNIHPPDERPKYNPSMSRITWPNGAVASVYSAEEPDKFRGPQFDTVVLDELAAWQRVDDAWSNIVFGLRLHYTDVDGNYQRAKCLITTTPRPISVLRKLIDNKDGSVIHIRGSSYENLANLSDNYKSDVIDQYEGTRLGRQEIYGDFLWDTPGALWNGQLIDDHRVSESPPLSEFSRVVVAVDPATTANKDSDMTGIVVAGVTKDGHAYVLRDATMKASPREWATMVVSLYHDYGANYVVTETNQGGDLVIETLRNIDNMLPVKGVHAKRGKYLRAEPVAARYEQGYIHHVGVLTELEGEMARFAPEIIAKDSPDRVDALVYALMYLAPGKRYRATWGRSRAA